MHQANGWKLSHFELGELSHDGTVGVGATGQAIYMPTQVKAKEQAPALLHRQHLARSSLVVLLPACSLQANKTMEVVEAGTVVVEAARASS